MNNKKVEELLVLIENVKQENSCNKIRLLYGPKSEDFISSITFPYYVVLNPLNIHYINDDKIYVLKDFEDFPPIKVVYENDSFDAYVKGLFENM